MYTLLEGNVFFQARHYMMKMAFDTYTFLMMKVGYFFDTYTY